MADRDNHNEEGNPLSVIHSAGTKRGQESFDGPASKRAHVDGEDNNLAVKILIPSAAVGAIIGKGGEAMRNLKNDHQCRVQMSKSSETYPGTSERICLVKGRVQNVIGVIDVILQKIREKCEGSTSSDAFDHKGVSRGNEVKIVMPNTSAGMVIGKSGANIKDIRETYGCQIQVFPKAGSAEAQNSLERIVTLAHEDHSQLIQATARVLEKVVADPHHTSEINKEDFGGKGGGVRTSNTSFTSASGFTNGGTSGTYNSTSSGFGSQTYGYQPNQQQAIKFNPMSGLGNQELLSFLDNLQSTLRSSGFNEASVAEVMQAMQVLAKYNIMGLGLGLGVAAMAQMRSAQETSSQMPSNHGVAGFGDQGGYAGGDQPPSVNLLLVEVLRSGSGAAANGENFASSVMVERRVSNVSIEIEVPDTIVGAVLGPKARTLQEIQLYSGCKVQVYKRDAKPNLPIGTRLISLAGEEKCMRMCRLMIERVVNEAQDRRVMILP
ncbi:KH domain protein [Dictyocaulus viviparus]|uniref:KH domain protein n=1 Tax=Dictyocaulus viviparus TaxID=29172 RepID=A0A0D8XM01_DICVI|nr:KH domain protein [Dictyocaulus viviparus]